MGSRYRSMAAAAVRLAGRVNFGPTVRRSSIIVPPPFFVTHLLVGESSIAMNMSVCVSVEL